MVSSFPRASRSSRLPFIVPSVAAACFRLVVACKFFNRRPSTPPRAQPISLFFLSLASIRRPKQWDNDHQTFRPGRVSSLTPPSPLTTTFGWLLCPPIKRRPSKAKRLPVSLFFHQLIRPPKPKRRAAVLPTHSDPASPLLQRTL
jgi:hypothetical protein